MPKRVLVVDDEVDVVLIVKTALMGSGYQVETVHNGPDALTAARENRPDLILLDVMMPGMTGFQVLRHLKADEALATIPVIMLTGVSERRAIQEALAGGTAFYIVKPFEFQELINKVEEAIDGDANDPVATI